jgi:hypothetical protein
MDAFIVDQSWLNNSASFCFLFLQEQDMKKGEKEYCTGAMPGGFQDILISHFILITQKKMKNYKINNCN